MKNVLGLDLGPNSIGWALIQWDLQTDNGRIIAANSRIIPMNQEILGNFERGNSISQTAERTQYRGIRRLRERELLRRERLHRVLHILGLLPKHYDDQIDFEWRLGQFKNHSEPKIAYRKENNKFIFIFQDSFNEMLKDFSIYQDENGKRSYETIPLNIVIERQKQGLDSAPEKNEKGNALLFSLSPNDLVYVPTEDEIESGIIDWSNKRKIAERVYKMVSSSGNQCFFIPGFVSNPIIQTIELGANNKAEKSWDNEMIKQFCIPLSINRLGIIRNI